jgi:hypothetical protein
MVSNSFARWGIAWQFGRIDFLDWAEAYITQLDPLSDTPTNPDQRDEKTEYYRSNEEPLKKSLATPTPPADTDEDEDSDFDDD